jgi:hypothetical protein
MSNNSIFSAANETLTTKCYFSMMDIDMESLNLNYLDHRQELRGVIKYKTANFLFPPKFFIGGTMGHNLK